jgi:hypothetical protein
VTVPSARSYGQVSIAQLAADNRESQRSLPQWRVNLSAGVGTHMHCSCSHFTPKRRPPGSKLFSWLKSCPAAVGYTSR